MFAQQQYESIHQPDMVVYSILHMQSVFNDIFLNILRQSVIFSLQTSFFDAAGAVRRKHQYHRQVFCGWLH